MAARKTTAAPIGKTVFGATVWAGTRSGRVLVWGGPQDHVHQHASAPTGRLLTVGEERGVVSDRCATLEQAQAAVDTYLRAATMPLERNHRERD